MCACTHDTVLIHVYDSDLLIHVCLSLHATWHSQHHSLGSSDSPGFSYQILELGAYGFSRMLIRDVQLKHGSSANHLKPYSSRSPTFLQGFPFVTCEHLLCYSLLYISLYSRICAYRRCNILIILFHIL